MVGDVLGPLFDDSGRHDIRVWYRQPGGYGHAIVICWRRRDGNSPTLASEPIASGDVVIEAMERVETLIREAMIARQVKLVRMVLTVGDRSLPFVILPEGRYSADPYPTEGEAWGALEMPDDQLLRVLRAVDEADLLFN